MQCPMCQGDLAFPLMGQVVKCPHCRAKLQMPFAPPDLPDEPAAPPEKSHRALWVIGGLLTLVCAGAGVYFSGVLTPFLHGTADTTQAVQRREVPSEAQGEEALRDLIAKESEGRMKLVSFAKIDGQPQKLLGVAVYQMNFRAKLEVTQDCLYLIDTESIGSGAGILTWPYRPDPGAASSARKGAQIEASGSVNFSEDKSGWRLLEVRITSGNKQAQKTPAEKPSNTPK